MNMYSELHKLYGNDVKISHISHKENKEVYKLEYKNNTLFALYHHDCSPVKFYKASHSLGLQNKLYQKNKNVSKIEKVIYSDNSILTIHESLEGRERLKNNPQDLFRLGQEVAKLHLATCSKKYIRPIPLIEHQSLYYRLIIGVKNLLNRVSDYFKYFSMRNLPKGVCHKDLNLANTIYQDDGEIAFIDFDRQRYVPLVVEFIIIYQKYLKNVKSLLSFIEGYNTIRKLSVEEILAIEKKLKIRLYN
ncbi:MAG: phosphotransferase [Alphaproteobacteria bacterium]